MRKPLVRHPLLTVPRVIGLRGDENMNMVVHGLSDGAPLDPAPVSSDSRRSARYQGYLTLYQVGSLSVGGQRELCLVKRVSSRGAVIRAYAPLRQGDCVLVELKGHAPIAGAVASADGTETEIRFEQAIDVQLLLKGGPGGPPPRMPRIDVRAFAWIRQGATVTRAIVHNVSQGGVSADCKAELEIGGQATVTLPGIGPREGVVRWSGRSGCGITFNSPVGLATLVEWLQAHAAAGGQPG